MLLGINTATPWLALALVEAGRPLAEAGRDVGSEHSEAIFTMLEGLFRDAGKAPADVTAIGVAIGPGGFTGVRTGLALAKTIAQIRGVPVYGVETLEALARQFPGARRVCPMLDARRGLVFAGLFGEGFAAGEAVAPALHPLETWLDATAARADAGGLVFVGEGAARYREAIVARRADWVVPPDALMAAGASAVATIAAERLAAGVPSDGAALAPLYLREPQAVVNWEALQAAKQGS